jgi:hypothetical protein
LFAFTDPIIAAGGAADMLIVLPEGELFLTHARVEVYRLIQSRRKEFPQDKQEVILHRLCEGPPRNWFREGAEIDRAVDRSRFDILCEMVRNGFDIGAEATKLLEDIRARWPEWQTRPAEQAGFLIWHESGPREAGRGTDKLKGFADSELVAEAKKLATVNDFADGDSWQSLCRSDPDRALRGLDVVTATGDWTPGYWEQLLFARMAYASPETEPRIAQLLLQWPPESFGKIAPAASSWLEEHAKTLPDDILGRCGIELRTLH